jgi:FixJ family two-component response regulator
MNTSWTKNVLESAIVVRTGTVFLVDDEASVRRALTRLLRASGFTAESFQSADDFLAAVPVEPGVSCVVVDLRLPGLSGLDLQQELRRRGNRMPFVFISGRADVSSGIQAMKEGAVDFLQKPISEQTLLPAIQSALERDIQRRAEQVERTELERRAGHLTPREREVFALVVTGLLNKQVGGELGTSEKTIKVHRARVMEKMRAGSLAELVRMADKLDLTLASIRRSGADYDAHMIAVSEHAPRLLPPS